jgi:hypothetical protein
MSAPGKMYSADGFHNPTGNLSNTQSINVTAIEAVFVLVGEGASLFLMLGTGNWTKEFATEEEANAAAQVWVDRIEAARA